MVMPSQGPTVVAVSNSSPDIVDMLRRVLESAGLVVVSAMSHQIREGSVDVDTFLSQHQPQAVLYRHRPAVRRQLASIPARVRDALDEGPSDRPDERQSGARAEVGRPDQQVYEIVERPIDLDAIVRAVKESVRARPTA
jgi:hypothetical protein